MTARINTLLRAGLLACCAAGGAGAADDPYQQMRLRWNTRLAGDTGSEAGAAIARAAQRHLDAMSTDAGAGALWADAGNWQQANGITASAVITTNYARLEAMALAYAHPGSPLRGDARLRDAILHGLDWMDQHHYHAGMQSYGNWWDWQIGTPLRLVNTLTLMYAELPPGLLARCLAAIDHFDPDPTRRTLRDGRLSTEIETGANRLDKALAVGLRGVLGRSDRHIAAGRDAVAQTLAPVTRGDGFYADGSFVQHNYIAYTGSYGLVALDDYAKLVYLHSGSPWPLPAATLNGILHWARESYVPWLFDGAMADAVRGRRISSEAQDDHYAGRRILGALAALAQAAPAGQADDLKAAIKGQVQRDLWFSAGRPDSAFSGYDLRQLKQLAADPAIRPADAPAGARVYASMDRALLHSRDFGFVISMYSDRISAFEYGNGEHARGWWNGIGMTSLYNADQMQYGGHYWPTIDSARLPGTTTDHSGSGLPPAWAMLGNRDGWAGGAQLDGYAAVALKFDLRDVTGSDLRGKKSWFLLGQRIVATGAGISGSNDAETIVDNRKLPAPGHNRLTVDGQPQADAPGAAANAPSADATSAARDVPHASWAHLAGSVPGAGIGYVFPDRAPLRVLRENRSGSWQAINSMESPATVSNTFISLAIPHGPQPRDASYCYILLPGADTAATAAYAAHHGVAILENSDALSAVRDADLGVTAANFWQAATLRVNGQPYLTASSPASIVLREQAGKLSLSIAEPTQHRQPAIEIELRRPAAALLQADPRITVLSLQPTVRLKIDASGSAGRSLSASFTLSRQPTPD
ncbi:polysaccharide lyase 8 family protein [Duganella callida]|uniref:Hyaluronate lyase n=1 Tax=Duganella callida TaxID=2561932 RepID=A0A4Y9S608_9BURK|nr:polysaccharide lyase 8 family protein [Duganella callida]TFW16806.1 hyaluronate lyase [Duganella callida]